MLLPTYFRQPPNIGGISCPAPLCCTISRFVRFEEVDPLNIAWHGHYASYFEEARVAFGKAYGLAYLDLYAAGIVAPIKQIHIDYKHPLHFDEECRITASLFWSDAARLNFEYEITNKTSIITTRGYTVQLFLSLTGDLYLAKPDYYEEFCKKWENGSFIGELREWER
ncbi:MAG: acyl-CoA thioesterase [Desulfovibrio sp.]|jgi:acyl-CoA thioester hydrolase|nr:acyl-CoA thioesterase [Desulfovibrio sp.]